ncbi:hypothetical protein [Phenylobacterium sp.]|uniref:hypothetical protein n=1 Tax=Phenylobacterium sp. TaxID=1871053 RepID=UPI002DF07BFA|nr:hypothetical protein [Phenylobacterium sp.]
MAPHPPQDPRVTDLRRYRRERERASRAARKPAPPNEKLLGGRRNAGVFLILAIAILAAMAYLQGHI